MTEAQKQAQQRGSLQRPPPQPAPLLRRAPERDRPSTGRQAPHSLEGISCKQAGHQHGQHPARDSGALTPFAESCTRFSQLGATFLPANCRLPRGAREPEHSRGHPFSEI